MRAALISLESFYDHSLALDYLVSYARSRPGIDRSILFKTFVEREGQSLSDLTSRLLEFEPDVVGFNTYVWNIEASVSVAKAVKSARRDATIVFGGMEATFNARAVLSENAEVDFVVVGEGEIAFVDLMERLIRNDLPTTRLPGLAWRDASKSPVVGPIATALQDLKDLPSPFLSPDFSLSGDRRVLYESYRGCNFHCSFCLYQREYAAVRYLPLERVASDLAAIMRQQPTHIRFVDATFNVNRRRAKDILRILKGCEADVCVEVSAEFFDTEMVDLLRPAGIRHVDIGLQSTQKSPLKAVQREWYREDRFKENLALLRSEPALTLNVELIAGLPGDNLAGLRASLDEAVMGWPDHVSVYRLLGLKGTSLERNSTQLGLRFAPAPPYELVESSGFSAGDLDAIDRLTFAHLVLFNLGVGRYALRYLVDAFKCRPTELYDEFVSRMLCENEYTAEQMRLLGRHHAYGNRFDQHMPDGLELQRVSKATQVFFDKVLPDVLSEGERELAMRLVDFGHSLARLDGVPRPAPAVLTERNSDSQLAPWCSVQAFSMPAVIEIARQGQSLGELSVSDVASIVFFVHPELGPAALATNQSPENFLGALGAGVTGLGRSVLDELRALAILV